MPRSRRLLLVITLALLSKFSVAAPCDENVECDKCAPASEFSWNPDNSFVTDRLSRCYELSNLLDATYSEGDYEVDDQLANEYLKLASVYRCNWNYGNAVHDANRILGSIPLQSGDLAEAERYLLESSHSTGSPQLDSFGPKLDLADALLKAGAQKSVAIYLENISSFWRMNNGVIEDWLTAINQGEEVSLHRSANAGSRTKPH